MSARSATRMPVHEHSGALAQGQLLLLPIGLAEYRVVREQHYGAGYPEGNRTRHHRIVAVHLKDALIGIEQQILLVRVGGVPAGEDRDK